MSNDVLICLVKNQIKSIEAIKGWDWTIGRVKAWQDKFNEVKNNLHSNKLNKSQNQWIRQQKYFYKNKLPKERIVLIENIEGCGNGIKPKKAILNNFKRRGWDSNPRIVAY